MSRQQDKGPRYIQIGVTGLRDPRTREYLKCVPLYVEATEGMIEGERQLIADIGGVLAEKYREYVEACEKAGATVEA